MLSFFLYLITTLFVVVCLFLILIVLIQKGRGGGLASAFGGGAGGHTAFGSKTGDVLTWATSIIFGVFLLLAILANLVFNAHNAKATGRTVTVENGPAAEHAEDNGTKGPGDPGSSLPQAPVTAD